MRKTTFLNYSLLIFTLLSSYKDYRFLYEVLEFIFKNYNFNLSFCNRIYNFILERSKYYEIQN